MLKHVLLLAGLVLAQWVFSVGVTNAQPAAPEAAEAPKSAEAEQVEKQIRAQADAFVAAFKKRDAAAIAAQWTADGVYISEEGERYEGRQAIESEYAALFKDCPADLEMRVEVDSVRLVNATTAIEEGRAAMTPQPTGATRVMSRYTAVHVNQEGSWLTAELRDLRVELAPDAGRLDDLDWIVGDWVAAKDDSSVEIKNRWVENNRFILRSNAVTESGKATDGGLEVIGVDPSTQRITSWSFTNDGGHAVGVWTPVDTGWMVESVGVMEDGTETAANYILSKTGDDSLSWKSVDRMVDGVLLPDMPEVVLKRKE